MLSVAANRGMHCEPRRSSSRHDSAQTVRANSLHAAAPAARGTASAQRADQCLRIEPHSTVCTLCTDDSERFVDFVLGRGIHLMGK